MYSLPCPIAATIAVAARSYPGGGSLFNRNEFSRWRFPVQLRRVFPAVGRQTARPPGSIQVPRDLQFQKNLPIGHSSIHGMMGNRPGQTDRVFLLRRTVLHSTTPHDDGEGTSWMSLGWALGAVTGRWRTGVAWTARRRRRDARRHTRERRTWARPCRASQLKSPWIPIRIGR
jgi:hypothetical protein